jgi:hypothetical protein
MSEMKKQIEVLKKQISAWKIRAEMAKKQGSGDLEQQARDKASELENKLAKLQEFEVNDD